MNPFNYFQPTDIRFGAGRLAELGELTRPLGQRPLLVTVPVFDAIAPAIERAKKFLADAGLEVAHFDGVVPNPTTESITAGAEAARRHKADVIIGMGGGSSMDSAKAIAVEATHEGSCWDYLFYKNPPTDKTLPVVAVSTTSGTGSQVTQVAVVTHTASRDKSALYHWRIFPRLAIVDPELVVTAPKAVTASTGWDAFCHAFESYIHKAASPYTDMVALEAIRLVASTLPDLLNDLENVELRSRQAWADTLAGLAIANAGVTLPHGIGMAISGMWPHVAHGQSLAAVYPAFTRFTWASAVERFATVARVFDPSLADAPDDKAAEALCQLLDDFLKTIGMWMDFKTLNLPYEEMDALAKQSMVLPDYQNNPRVATEKEMRDLMEQCYSYV